MKNVKLIIGSTRQGRVAKPIADWLVAHAKAEGIELGVLDLAEINLPMYDAAVPPAYMPTQTTEGKAWQAKVAETEAFVFLTAEYNRSIPAPLKNAIDYLFDEWKEKPAAIVSYGYVDGGGSATKHLKDILSWVKMDIVEQSVAIPFTQELFENGQFKDIDAALSSVKAPFIEVLKAVIAQDLVEA
jgi:NAD(P)H-dependent FMN reductase